METEVMRLLALKGDGATGQGMRGASRMGKAMASPSAPREGMEPCQHLDFNPGGSCWSLTYRAIRIKWQKQ